MPQLNNIIDKLTPYIIGAILGIVGTFVTGFAKEFFDERARRFKHKLNVARHVLEICNEASTGNFRKTSRNTEHVNSVLTNLDGVDEKMGVVMNSFVSLWGRLVDYSEDTRQGESGIRHYAEMLNDVEQKRKTLVTWANKIRAGN